MFVYRRKKCPWQINCSKKKKFDENGEKKKLTHQLLRIAFS